MKYVKVFGLAAIATAALMAFVGSSTASATVLCKTPGTGETTGTTCPEGWAYTTGQTVHAVSEGVTKLTTSFKNIECNKSTLHGHQENEGSATETVGIEVTILTFEECNCEVKVIHPGTMEIHWVPDTHNGTITSKNAEVTASCSTIFGNVHCIYSTGAGTDLGTLTSTATTGKTATVDVEEANIPRLTTSAICAEKAKWDAKYEITEPDTLYVTDHT